MAEVSPPYTDEQLAGDGVSKKDLVVFLQENSSLQFQLDNKLKGAVKNVVKMHTKDNLITIYNELFKTKAFKTEGGDQATEVAIADAKAKDEEKKLAARTQKLSLSESDGAADSVPRYTKRVAKNGDKKNFPKKGDTVACFYTGKLENGTVFDTNTTKPKGKGKQALPLRFKVGQGKVIKGWDEALLTMSVGEKAEVIIEPVWAYGKKGLEGRIPPNSTLHFDIELVAVE